MKEPFCK